nr:hypothetical protein [Tanacetum cinerariifolium]
MVGRMINSTQSRAYRVFNKRTRVIIESIHVNFDELPQMASNQNSSDPEPKCQTMALNHDSLSPAIQRQANVFQVDKTVKMSIKLDLLFSLMFDEFLNGHSQVVSKSSAVSAADAPNQHQGETSSRHVDSSNMNTFYQRFPSEHRWTKDHPLEQVIGNPSQSVRTRRQLELDAKMCMFVLTVSQTEPKNIKEAMADSAWIESMQEELHQFDRLDIWELVDRPLCTNVINLKWLWKNKRDEENTVIRNKSRLVAKGYAQQEGVDFEESFAPIARLEAEEVYINQLDGFVDPYHPDKVYRLKKALYGLKQAPRAWRTNYKDFQNCLFACYLSQMEPKKPIQAIKDASWVEAMQEDLLQFKLLNVWTLVDLPKDKWEIGTKWIFRNKKDERGIVIKNKARLVTQGHTQKEGIDYDEVFSLVARIEAIRLFLAYASFKDFVVYQIDVKSAFLYGKIEEEVYVCQPLGFGDPDFPDKVYKVKKALYGLHQAPRAWKEMSTEFESLMHDKFQMSSMGELSFFMRLQTTSTPMEPNKALIKDAEAEDVDVHLYRSLMYLTASRPDITFAFCACARFQVTPKTSHLHAVKRIFRYLKGQPKLGLWYLRDSPFDLEAYSDSDYAGASLDTKSITGVSKISQSSGPTYLVANETVYKEWEDIMKKVATTASSLEAEHDSGNINMTQSMATLNEPLPQETSSGSGPRFQVTILGGAKAQTRFEAAFKQSNDLLLLRVHTLRS